MREQVKDMADLGAGGIAAGTVLGVLPEIAAGLAIIWTLIRIYEWFRVRILGKPAIQSLVDELEAFKAKAKETAEAVKETVTPSTDDEKKEK